jgi:protein-tyrosine phosphatase
MHKVFWLVPGELAGRSGPDQDPWDLAQLRAAGFRAVLSVNDGEHCDRAALLAHGINYACVPFSTSVPPIPGDDRICCYALPLAYAFVTRELHKGHPVLVHCTAGKDRTGLFLAYFLMQRLGLSPHGAIQAVRRVRPIALSAAGWDGFAREVLANFALETARGRAAR